VTLLDLDRERKGGGWGRVKYAIEQLIEIGKPAADLLKIEGGILTKKQLGEMHGWDAAETKNMAGWIESLEKYGVFFSQPLDLDFIMLKAFPAAYQGVSDEGDGPDIPDDAADYTAARKRVVRSVLKDAGTDGGTYSDDELRLFFWYRYLFLGRGKPSTHLLALSALDDDELKDNAPDVLLRLIDRMIECLEEAETEGTDDD
jgi:hypothetical protein